MNSSLPLSSPPPGYVSLAAIQPLVYVLISGVVWSSILVTMFFFMFIVSTPQIRRTPLFIMNVISVVSGAVASFVQVVRMASGILHPYNPINPFIQRAPPAFFLVLPIYIDCILAVRLSIVYPREMTSALLLATIFIPVVVLKVLRTTNVVYVLIRYSQLLERGSSIWEALATIWLTTPCLKIEWLARLVDNCWASIWFLFRLRRDVMVRSSTSDVVASNRTLSNVARQMRNLFCLGLSSFVFPCILNLISVILYYKGSIFSGTYLFVTNNYIQIIGVLLATIWVSKERTCPHSEPVYPAGFSASLSFHAATLNPRGTWASRSLVPGPTDCVEGRSIVDNGTTIKNLNSLVPTPGSYIPPKENIVS
ncbi:hypothetical protein DL96DRAFT_372229 [Flagelloscypha sp. PMI_526]|nr:hypothetical protein DL96DRAFT_372229 [Flagelloscypha sp. PMI_526]